MPHKKTIPPKLAEHLLLWFLKDEMAEEVLGDLDEKFYSTAKQRSAFKAKLNYWYQVFHYFRPFALKVIKTPSTHTGMLSYSLKIGSRNLIKRKEFTLINVLGLALGIASALLLTLYIHYEYSYDKTENSDRIFKLVQEVTNDQNPVNSPTAPYSLVPIILHDYPEVESGTALAGPYNNQLFSYENEEKEKVTSLENSVLLADSNFFSVFDLKVLKGNASKALTEPNSVVLTESTALRFFGHTDVIGKAVAPSGKNSIITAVCQDPPPNSHLNFNYLVSSTSVNWLSQKTFSLKSAHCYFKLNKKESALPLEQKLSALLDRYIIPEIEKSKQTTWSEYTHDGNGIRLFLKPIEELHLSSDNLGGFEIGGNAMTIRILTIIAIFILGVAIINFINLSTARSTERAREVGVRKVIGSTRGRLIMQFLAESLIISTISMAIGVAIAYISLPYFNTLSGVSLVFPLHWEMVSLLGLLAILIGYAAGLYPAFVLSAFSPEESLKGQAAQHQNSWLRNGLVTFQFWIAIILIIGTFIIRDQLHYLKEKNLGFDQDQVIVIEGAFHQNPKFSSPFLQKIRSLSSIKEAATSLWVQGFQSLWSDEYQSKDSSTPVILNRTMIGDGFAEVMGLELLEGSFFSEQTHDSLAILLNESAVKELGLIDPVEQSIELTRDQQEPLQLTVKGIVKDFHYHSLHQKIEPLVIQSNEINHGRAKYIVTKLKKGTSIQKTLAEIEDMWKTTIPDRPFNFKFLDETLEAKYQNEQRTAKILAIFSILTILIACIGLFALSAYTVHIRTKEISIRKVLGAQTLHIIMLLSKHFAIVLSIAFLLGIPVAWYSGTAWLEDFAYRTAIRPETFVQSGLLVALVTLITIGYHTLNAALKSAVHYIKSQ